MLHPVEQFFLQQKHCYWLPTASIDNLRADYGAWLCKKLFPRYFSAYPHLFESTVPADLWEQFLKSSPSQQEKSLEKFVQEKLLRLHQFEQHNYAYSLLHLCSQLPNGTTYVIANASCLFENNWIKTILLEQTHLHSIITSWQDEWFAQDKSQRIILVFKKDKKNTADLLHFVQLQTTELPPPDENLVWQKSHPDWQYAQNTTSITVGVNKTFLQKAGTTHNWFKYLKINALYASLWEKCRYFFSTGQQYISTKNGKAKTTQLDFLGIDIEEHLNTVIFKKTAVKCSLHNSLAYLFYEIETASPTHNLLINSYLLNQLTVIKPEILTNEVQAAYQHSREKAVELPFLIAQYEGYFQELDKELLAALGIDDVINTEKIYENTKQIYAQRIVLQEICEKHKSSRKQKKYFKDLLHQHLTTTAYTGNLADFAATNYIQDNFFNIELPTNDFQLTFFLGKHQLMVKQDLVFETESSVIANYLKELLRTNSSRLQVPKDEKTAIKILQDYQQRKEKPMQVFQTFLQKKLLNEYFASIISL